MCTVVQPSAGKNRSTSAVDIYIKELIKKTVSGNRTLRIDGYLTNIQEAFQNVLGPAPQLWALAVKQRDKLLAVEVPEDKTAW